MSGDCATERGEEGSGEKGEEALQKRKQYSGHADCHEPPQPAKFISHHVHVGAEGLIVRCQVGADGLYFRCQVGTDGLHFGPDFLNVRCQVGADGLYFRCQVGADGPYFRLDSFHVRFGRQVLVRAFYAGDSFCFGCHCGFTSVLRSWDVARGRSSARGQWLWCPSIL